MEDDAREEAALILGREADKLVTLQCQSLGINPEQGKMSPLAIACEHEAADEEKRNIVLDCWHMGIEG